MQAHVLTASDGSLRLCVASNGVDLDAVVTFESERTDTDFVAATSVRAGVFLIDRSAPPLVSEKIVKIDITGTDRLDPGMIRQGISSFSDDRGLVRCWRGLATDGRCAVAVLGAASDARQARLVMESLFDTSCQMMEILEGSYGLEEGPGLGVDNDYRDTVHFDGASPVLN